MSTVDFTAQIVVVTGAGAGLGRRYAIDFAAAGATVVVHARRSAAAREVVEEITERGGSAVAVVADARDGAAIVDAAIEHCGHVDALVVNAGQARDRTFSRMSEEEWTDVLDTHLGGAYAITSAVWPHLIARGSGRIVLTTSGAGLHGNFGQANYAAAKAGIIGLTKTLAIEGRRAGVLVNAVAPMAHTAMTDPVFDENLRAGLPAEAVSPFVLALAHPDCPGTGAVLETGGGWAGFVRWERSAGMRFEPAELNPTAVLRNWAHLSDFDERADHPASTADSLAAALGQPASPEFWSG